MKYVVFLNKFKYIEKLKLLRPSFNTNQIMSRSYKLKIFGFTICQNYIKLETLNAKC